MATQRLLSEEKHAAYVFGESLYSDSCRRLSLECFRWIHNVVYRGVVQLHAGPLLHRDKLIFRKPRLSAKQVENFRKDWQHFRYRKFPESFWKMPINYQ